MKLSIEELLNELSVTEKFILLLLYAGKEGVKGPLWLQKEIFELAKSIRELAEELDFSAYSYGPWSEALTEARDMLENSGLIVSQEDGRLVLTEEGKKMAQILWHKTDEKIISLLKEIREFLESLDWDELLLYIYSTSPTMADKSVKYKDIMKRRVEIALKMLRQGKVSTEMAARLAGLNIKDFRKQAISKGIKPFSVSKRDLN